MVLVSLTLSIVRWLQIFWLSDRTYGYWLMAANNILTTQRIDPIVNPGVVSTHVHGVIGGSNFGLNTTTELLQASECTSVPIPQDKSAYWYPQLYFQWANGSFTSVQGNPVIDAPGNTTAFPKDFRMLSGDPTLRTLDPSSFAQQAVTFLCLDFNGKSTRFNELPKQRCPSGIRSQINFPSCWDGVNTDSPDHRSHVAFLSTGPDNGTCLDTKFMVTIPRIFMEVYWVSQEFDDFRRQAAIPDQPFVFSNGDPTGYSYHADFFSGWDDGVLQRALNECNCNPYGDPSCCVSQGIFNLDQSKRCFVSATINETTLGTLESLPGDNPVQSHCFEEYFANYTPALLSPAYVFTDANVPPPTGTVSVPAQTFAISQSAQGTCIGNAASDSMRYLRRRERFLLGVLLLSAQCFLF